MVLWSCEQVKSRFIGNLWIAMVKNYSGELEVEWKGPMSLYYDQPNYQYCTWSCVTWHYKHVEVEKYSFKEAYLISTPLSNFTYIKCLSISLCLVWSCCIGLCVMLMVNLFSQHIFISYFHLNFNFFVRFWFIQAYKSLKQWLWISLICIYIIYAYII